MKRYFIESSHEIFIDTFEQGEGENVNFYDLSKVIEANNVEDAINEYFEKELFYKFDKQLASSFEDNNKLMFYNVLVDADNNEANERQIENWKVKATTLYSNNISLSISEIVECEINF